MYTDEFGVKFSDDRTKLIRTPADLKGEYVVPDGVTVIDEAAFQRCEQLTSVSFPEGLTTIDNSAFMFCKALQSVQFPKSLKWLEAGAFMYCSSLKSVTLHSKDIDTSGVFDPDCEIKYDV